MRRRSVADNERWRPLTRCSPRADLGKLWFDAVAYGPEELEFVGKVAGRSAEYEGKLGRCKSTSRAEGAVKEGISRMMFG